MNEQTQKCKNSIEIIRGLAEHAVLVFLAVLFVFYVALLLFQGFPSIFLKTVLIVVP